MSDKKTCNGNCQPNCCESAPPVTVPMSVHNPAGLSVLRGRVGDHRSFFESLRRRLSSQQYPLLRKLATRSLTDPTIALLDSWSVVGDVLTFYNERYLQEAYHRTAKEVRSLQELSKLIGYRPGPGVASSVYLAFTLEKSPEQASLETLIPKGTQVQSVPGSNESAQTFETMEDFPARSEWSLLKPRQHIPQLITTQNVNSLTSLFLQGIDRQLKIGDRLIITPSPGSTSAVHTISEILFDYETDTTELRIGETPFSIRRIYEEVYKSIEPCITTADAVIAFPWITTNVRDELVSLRDGVGEEPPLIEWKSLSYFDKRLSEFTTSLDSSDPAAKNALTEFNTSTSPVVTMADKVKEEINAGCDSLASEAKSICDAVTNLDPLALAFFVAAKSIGNPNVAAQVLSAKTGLENAKALDNTTWTTVEPLILPALALHKARLKTLFDTVQALNIAHTVGTPPPGPTPAEITSFQDARNELRAFWGLLADGTNFQPGALALRTAFASETPKLSSPLSAYPHDALVDSCVELSKLLTVSPHAGNGPTAARIDEIKRAFQDTLDRYSARLDTVSFTAPTISSQVISQLSLFIQRSINVITSAATFPLKHQHARDQQKAIALGVAAARAVANMVATWTKTVNDRRQLFADEAQALLSSFGTLATFGGELAALWASIETVVRKASTKVVTAPVTDSRYPPLEETIGSFGNDDAPVIGDVRAFHATDQVTEQIVRGLLRELRRFTSLNGGGVGAGTAPIVVSTSGGGIGQVVQPESNMRATSIRVATDVLEVPENSASDVVAQLATSFGLVSHPELRAKWRAITYTTESPTASVLSAPIPLFGYNAPKPIFDEDLHIIQPAAQEEWDVNAAADYVGHVVLSSEVPSLSAPFTMILQTKNIREAKKYILAVRTIARTDYGISAKAMECDLDNPTERWTAGESEKIDYLRNTVALVPTRSLDLCERSIYCCIGKGAESQGLEQDLKFDPETREIELDGLYLGISPGQEIILEGERVGLAGVVGSESLKVLYVRHKLRPLPGDTVHTRIYFASDIRYSYVRRTVTIYANVVRATHGETSTQILGSGDASKAFQTMALGKGPLTYLPTPNETGVQSTIEVRVNDIQWHETGSLLESPADGRNYVVQDQPEAMNTVQFGDGKTGARLPTGNSNVVATYRTGLGKAGNVRSKTITNLASRPLGVKEVTNPLPATGGADPETAEQIRANAPLAVMALDRLVSVRDYADFARNFAGIDKAIAMPGQVNAQPTICVTIAGAGDVPLEGSELIGNLVQAYQRLGDPLQKVQVMTRELLLLFLGAKVRLKPDYRWGSVKPQIQQSLYNSFSFARRELGQPVYLSDVCTAIQNVDGVAYVDVDLFGTLSQTKFQESLKQSQSSSTTPQATSNGVNGTSLGDLFKKLTDVKKVESKLTAHAGRVNSNHEFEPAQLIYLSPDVSDSLYLDEVTS